ncbi:MAG: hypothetical protein ABSA52_09505 [Candidatus Binatia bacterium]
MAAMGPGGRQFVAVGVGNKGHDAQKEARAQLNEWFDRVSGNRWRPLISKRDFEAAITGRHPARKSYIHGRQRPE